MSLKQDLATWSETGKNAFSLLRDALLFSLLLLLVACPAVINDRLERTGLTTVEGPGFRWERKVEKAKQQAVEAVTTVEQVRRETAEALIAVNRIAAENPQIAARVEPIQKSLQSADRRLQSAGAQLDSAVSTQQALLPGRLEGWVSLNFVTVEGPLQRGTEGTVRSRPLRVREEANSRSEVLGILPVGTRVEIREVRGNFARIVSS